MATVKATCPGCGDVELGIRDVRIQVCASTSASTYAFQCPVCRLMVNKDASERIVDALTGAGARIVMWTLPGELTEPKMGPPITHDDLLAFHLGLEDGHWRDELAAVGPDL